MSNVFNVTIKILLKKKMMILKDILLAYFGLS